MSNTHYTNVFGKNRNDCGDLGMYSFKRDFYNDVKTALESSAPVTLLIGPRKCGKTVCLHQIKQEYPNAIYKDIKSLTEDGRVQLMYTIQQSIINSEDLIYLVDEVTYWQYPDSTIELFANAYAEANNSKTKLVLAGSQSRALECWGHRSFAGNANFIRMSFMDYSEWLRYAKLQGISDGVPSIKSYNQFLFHIDKFYGMETLQDYLQGCLDETVISNTKSSNIIINNDCDLLTVPILLDMLYSILISRHNRSNIQTFSDRNILASDIRRFFNSSFTDNVKERVSQFLLYRYDSLKGQKLETLRQAVCFLYNCGLISVTHTVKDISQEVDMKSILFNENLFEQNIKSKTDFFYKFSFSIKHPMFYLAVLKLILLEDMPEELPPELLGSLVECHVRGLMPEAYGCEYHDDLDRELDYLNLSYGIALEITIADKKISDTHFECVSNCPLKVLTTKTRLDVCNSVYRIPYVLFIEYISRRFKYDIPNLWALPEELNLF